MFRHFLHRSFLPLCSLTKISEGSSTPPRLLRTLFNSPTHKLLSSTSIQSQAFSTKTSRFNKLRDTIPAHTQSRQHSSRQPQSQYSSRRRKGSTQDFTESCQERRNEHGNKQGPSTVVVVAVGCWTTLGIGWLAYKGYLIVRDERNKLSNEVTVLKEECTAFKAELAALRDEWVGFRDEWKGVFNTREGNDGQDGAKEEEGIMEQRNRWWWIETLGGWEFILSLSQSVGWVVFFCFKGWEMYGDNIWASL